MSDIAKGGRGKKAPYSTTHFRIPEPIKPVVEQLAIAYREALDDDPDELLRRVQSAITSTEEKPVNKNPDYQAIRDRILAITRSDKLKAVKTALDKFIAFLEGSAAE
jgi:hypothetical protein